MLFLVLDSTSFNVVSRLRGCRLTSKGMVDIYPADDQAHLRGSRWAVKKRSSNEFAGFYDVG
jgi:hypothetical protein